MLNIKSVIENKIMELHVDLDKFNPSGRAIRNSKIEMLNSILEENHKTSKRLEDIVENKIDELKVDLDKFNPSGRALRNSKIEMLNSILTFSDK